MAENVMADENATTEIASRDGAVSLVGDGRGQHRIRVFYDGRRFLLWNARNAYILRCVHRLVGRSLIGALPNHKRQNGEKGLPLSLLFEEALLAVEEGIIEVVDVSRHNPQALPAGEDASAAVTFCVFSAECPTWALEPLEPLSPEQLRLAGCGRLLHAQVFRALWQRGLYVTSAATFGADYMCYHGDPLRYHAHMLVQVALPGRAPRAVEMACSARLATSVKKTVYIASCGVGAEVRLDPIELPEVGTVRMSSQEVGEIATVAAEAAAARAAGAAGAAGAGGAAGAAGAAGAGQTGIAAVDAAQAFSHDSSRKRSLPCEAQLTAARETVQRLVLHSHTMVESDTWHTAERRESEEEGKEDKRHLGGGGISAEQNEL